MLIDLSDMRAVEVDPDARTARVEGGATWGDFDAAAQTRGLAAPGPTVSTVGVAGATLGGGSGWLLRRHGLSLDSLTAAELVTAGAEVVRASERENPDLFWALRGGGGNFGVVTAMEFRLYETGPDVLAGQVIHRLNGAPAVLRAFRDAMDGAPDDVMAYAFFIRVPSMEGFLEAHHGEVVLSLVVCHAGPPEEAEAALRPLRAIGEPLADTVQAVPFLDLQRSFDAALPGGARYLSLAHYLGGLPDDVIAAIVEGVSDLQGELTMAYLEPVGGAAGRVAADATAFPHRDAAWSFHVLAGWTDAGKDEEVSAWARRLHDAATPAATGGVYVNLLSGDDPGRVRAAYGGAYDRLTRVKAEWDPENRFRSNHNVPPAERPR
jgi:FAD/FMN-containing dehydrogenase